MEGFTDQCVELYLEWAHHLKNSDLRPVSTACLDDHQIQADEFEAKGELAVASAHVVLKNLFLVRRARPDLM